MTATQAQGFGAAELKAAVSGLVTGAVGEQLTLGGARYLALANRVVQVSRAHHLDIVHAHYAVPHATAAFLAKQILSSGPPSRVPKIITTLHGTDITLVGRDESYLPITKFGIEESDGDAGSRPGR